MENGQVFPHLSLSFTPEECLDPLATGIWSFEKVLIFPLCVNRKAGKRVRSSLWEALSCKPEPVRLVLDPQPQVVESLLGLLHP